MTTAANILIALVALLHLYFMVLEMFLWDTPFGRKTFRLTPEFSAASKALAANQGLYNGFLAAGLLWGLALGPPGEPIKIFFLACVICAGVFGAFTVSRGASRGCGRSPSPAKARASAPARRVRSPATS